MRIALPTLAAFLFALAAPHTAKAAAPTLAIPMATPATGGRATLSVVVTTGGAATTVTFKYGSTDAYGLTTPPQPVAGTVTAALADLVHGATYHYQAVAVNADGPASSSDRTFVANVAPVATADRAFAAPRQAVRIPVLANDRDPDRDRLTIRTVTQGARGTVRIEGRSLIYTAASSFQGADSFTYTIADSFGGKGTATVSIAGVAQTFGALVKDRESKAVGYLRLNSLATGGFTGRLEIEEKFYRLVGRFDLEGRFRGSAVDEDGGRISVAIRVVPDGEKATLAVEIGGGEFAASDASRTLTAAGLAGLKGRYTVELPALSGSTSPDEDADADETEPDDSDGRSVPAGNGWMSIKLDSEGNARIKGKSGDGRSFSARAVVGGSDEAPTLPVFITPDGAALTGVLSFGESISGNLAWTREASDASDFPDGFSANVRANGGRYESPEKGEHALASETENGRTGEITVSEGKVPGFTRQLRFSKRDSVRVTDRGEDRIDVDIDRKSGTFRGRFRILSDLGRRVKFSGVLLQDEGRGSGVFLDTKKSGRVEISITDGPDTVTPVEDNSEDPTPANPADPLTPPTDDGVLFPPTFDDGTTDLEFDYTFLP